MIDEPNDTVPAPAAGLDVTYHRNRASSAVPMTPWRHFHEVAMPSWRDFQDHPDQLHRGISAAVNAYAVAEVTSKYHALSQGLQGTAVKSAIAMFKEEIRQSSRAFEIVESVSHAARHLSLYQGGPGIPASLGATVALRSRVFDVVEDLDPERRGAERYGSTTAIHIETQEGHVLLVEAIERVMKIWADHPLVQKPQD